MMNTKAQKLLLCCYSSYTCQPAQNGGASWSTLVLGQAENTYEMTCGTKAIYVHKQEVLEQARRSSTASRHIWVSHQYVQSAFNVQMSDHDTSWLLNQTHITVSRYKDTSDLHHLHYFHAIIIYM